MRQDFSAVDLSQLGRLFPIQLSQHRDEWAHAYAGEAAHLRALLGEAALVRISHIGSTAVPGLLAKPTVDILLEVGPAFDLEAAAQRLLDEGYVRNDPPQDMALFLKGYTPQGFVGQAFHIHVRAVGDWDEPYFRDWLRERPEVAAQYAALKLALKREFEHDRDAYTQAKGAFVARHTHKARAAFGPRYACYRQEDGTMFEILDRARGIALVRGQGTALLASEQEALDLIATASHLHSCSRLVVRKEDVAEPFFDLSTRLAGGVLQKFVNYGAKLAIVGDFEDFGSDSLRAFILESNRGSTVFFVADIEQALQKLAAAG